jgi:phosphate transport system permease protein
MPKKKIQSVKSFCSIEKSRSAKELSITIILLICALAAVGIIFSILLFLFNESVPAFLKSGIDLIFGTSWHPEKLLNNQAPQLGGLPLIMGTLITTFGAMLIAVPLSIATAIFIAELAPPRLKSIAKPAVELLAGIPSVVYGFFGLIVLVPWLNDVFKPESGYAKGWLAGSIILAIMAIPTITSVTEDAITSVPQNYKEGSLALGATRWQSISKVVLPSSLSGITAAIILGMGRAIGETMAVMMVVGNSPLMPDIAHPFTPVRTLTSTIALEMQEAPGGTIWQDSLFALAFILLIIILIINLIAYYVLKRLKEKHLATGSSYNKKHNQLPKIFKNLIEKIKQYAKIIVLGITLLFILAIFGILAAVFIGIIYVIFSLVRKRISPKNAQRIAFGIISLSIIIVLIFLGIILFDIVSNGIGAINWEFLTASPQQAGRAGGIFPAILGTIYLAIGAIIIALPIGVCAAIYLTEYTKEGIITKIIRTCADLLNGTPSIVFGLFGLTLFIYIIGFEKSLLVGQIILAFMILPTIIRTTEEAIKSVPQSLREGSYALGATRWQTIRRVVLPPSSPGILTGAILGIGRAAGETAPIMFTAAIFTTRFAPSSFSNPTPALPYHLYILATGVPNSTQNQYGTALVLVIVVLLLYSAAILLRNHFRKKLKW